MPPSSLSNVVAFLSPSSVSCFALLINSMVIGFLLLCVNLVLSMAMYTDMDSVVELSLTNFDQKVLANQKLVAVEFYASWCGHCQTFAPEWMEVAKKLKGLVMVSAIKCDDDGNQDICAKYNVNRYPTIIIFQPKMNDEGIIVKSTRDYYGPRDSKLLVKHLLASLPSKVRSIKWDTQKVKSKSSMSLNNFLEQKNDTLAKVILFSDKRKTMAPYNALSMDFGDGQLLMGEVKKAEKMVVDTFGIKTFPTLLVLLPGEGGRSLEYDYKFTYKALYKYLSNIALTYTTGGDGLTFATKKTGENQKHYVKHDVKSLQDRAFSDSFGGDYGIKTSSDSIVMAKNNGVTDHYRAKQDDDRGQKGKPLARDEL